ncbi:class A basic helix-loop-helix protein 15 isoform X2 [Melanotaenia boesemani]|uniref:class A basic helix-loop-helix protein 15 isoform X2 n=1 Tax=Melanotaenia boesemani TaxID=1250792 RepID=UPI001C03F385|nr:class A basic helix-loop-helix protein 15 isoform X2 [Melanotaenia boesemani]
MATSQDSITIDAMNKFIVSFDDSIPAQLCSDIYSPQHWRTSTRHAACCNSDYANMPITEDTTAQRPPSHTINSEDAERENSHTCSLGRHLKSYQNYNYLKEASGRVKSIKMKKSVSFDEDVMVYLFDQESPTLELHSEPCISQSNSCPCNLQGLQWEDDFSALENSCHFQYPSRCSHTFSMPTQGWTALSRPEHCSLSQTCLFLTYVTESDLEL